MAARSKAQGRRACETSRDREASAVGRAARSDCSDSCDHGLPTLLGLSQRHDMCDQLLGLAVLPLHVYKHGPTCGPLTKLVILPDGRRE